MTITFGSPAKLTGSIHVDGNLHLKGAFTLATALYCTGTIFITTDSYEIPAHPENLPVLTTTGGGHTGGNIIFSGNSNLILTNSGPAPIPEPITPLP